MRVWHRDEPKPPGEEVPRECKRPRYGTRPTMWLWKYRYPDAAAAVAGAPEALAAKRVIIPYACGFCGWWHFGTGPKDATP